MRSLTSSDPTMLHWSSSNHCASFVACSVCSSSARVRSHTFHVTRCVHASYSILSTFDYPHTPVCTVLSPRYKSCTPPWRFISPDAHTLGGMQRPFLAWPHSSFTLTYYQWRSSCAHTARRHNLIHHHFLLYGQLRYLIVLSAAHACPTTHAYLNIDSCAHTYYSNTSLRIQTRFGSVAPSDVMHVRGEYDDIRRMRKLDDGENV